MFETFATIALILLPFSMLGLFVFVQTFRRPHEPADDSNLFNAWRLLWYALSPKWRGKLSLLVAWLRKDEGELLPLPDPPEKPDIDTLRGQVMEQLRESGQRLYPRPFPTLMPKIVVTPKADKGEPK